MTTTVPLGEDPTIYCFYDCSTEPFANFYELPFTFQGKTYKSVEHCYASQKFIVSGDPEYAEIIRTQALTPMDAHIMGQFKKNKFKAAEWELQKRDIAKQINKAKIEQHKDFLLKKLINETKGKTIVQLGTDVFWDQYMNEYDQIVGQNEKGKILMELRDELILSYEQNKL